MTRAPPRASRREEEASVAGVGEALLGLGDGGVDEVDGAFAMAALVGARLHQLLLRRPQRAQRRLHVGLVGVGGEAHGKPADNHAGEKIDGGSETAHADLRTKTGGKSPARNRKVRRVAAISLFGQSAFRPAFSRKPLWRPRGWPPTSLLSMKLSQCWSPCRRPRGRGRPTFQPR